MRDPGPQKTLAVRQPAPQVGHVPELVAAVGPKAARRFTTFFTDDIENHNTRAAYLRAAFSFFDWCTGMGLAFESIQSVHVAAYREQLKRHRYQRGTKKKRYEKATIKQHLAAIRKLYDWLVIGQVIPFNLAAAVRGPKHVVTEGLTPILDEEEMQTLLASIDTSSLVGKRDLAYIATLTATFGRAEAATAMDIDDYYPDGKSWSIRLRDKNAKIITMPVHHRLEEILDDYIAAAGGADAFPQDDDGTRPLFRTTRGQTTQLTAHRMTRYDAFRMIRRRAQDAGIAKPIGNHSFRGTGITNFLENGGKPEDAQFMAGHSSARTTKLYDRRQQRITRGEVERIAILG